MTDDTKTTPCVRCSGTGERWFDGDRHRSAGMIPCGCGTPIRQSTDLVGRLRRHAAKPYNVLVDGPLAADAASEIERLREALRRIVSTSMSMCVSTADLAQRRGEIAREALGDE